MILILAYSRIDTCKPQYLDKLKKAEWIRNNENPSTIIRKEVHKDVFKNVKIIDIINSMRDAGIYVAQIIFLTTRRNKGEFRIYI